MKRMYSSRQLDQLMNGILMNKFKWFDKIEPKKIISVEMIKKKDIEFKFNLEDGSCP